MNAFALNLLGRAGKKPEVPVKRLFQGSTLADVADLGSVDGATLMEEYATFAGGRAEVRSRGAE